MYSRLPSRCFKSSIIRRHALNGLPLNKQQCRGVKITRFALSFPPYFPAENAQRKNLDRSYDKLLSETESDVQELQNATPPSHQAHNVLEGDAIDGAQSSKWDSIRQKLRYPPATCTLKDLETVALDTIVILHGYVTSPRNLGQLVFVDFFDFEGGRLIQVVSYLPRSEPSPEILQLHNQLISMKQYTPVALVGRLVRKAASKKPFQNSALQHNDTLKPFEDSDKPKIEGRDLSDYEIFADRIHVLNDISNDIMFTKDSKFGPADRHLQLRTELPLRRALRTRARVASMCRSELEKNGFLEVETPILFKSTPEGAREFLVPTRQKGLMYALPQSPQQYKQILMASGVRRYFQFAKCFRDEDLRADRQPEFTQLDLEMSFAGARDVMTVMEDLIRKIWAKERGLSGPRLTYPFAKMPYDLAMTTFGTDKPDLRFSHSRIRDVTVILPHLQNGDPNLVVEAFAAQTKPVQDDPSYTEKIHSIYESVLSRPELQTQQGDQPVISFVGPKSTNAELLQRAKFDTRDQVQKFLSASDDQIVVIQARPKGLNGGNTHLGLIRDALMKESYLRYVIPRSAIDQVVWITDFPLFKPNSEAEPGQGGQSGFSSNHHPFTAPQLRDIHLLETDPLKVRAEHFDLVVNGVELGGGSARIHDPDLQKFILKDIIKVPEQRLSQFDHLLRVLASGCPPHAGMALGYDRLIAMLGGFTSVRDVIAFPKNGKGHDPMVASPGLVGDEELKPYFLKHA